MIGRHIEKNSKQLEKELEYKKQELEDLKDYVADIFLKIRALNESNSCGNEDVRRRKISELCTDTAYDLCLDDKKVSI